MTTMQEWTPTPARLQAQARRELAALRKCLKRLDNSEREFTIGECRLMATTNMALRGTRYDADDADMVFGAIEAIVDSAGSDTIARDAVMHPVQEWAYRALNS